MMDNNLINKLKDQLKIDEGVKYEIYEDHLGYATFGIGHLITDKDPEYGWPVGTKVSEDRVNKVFKTDVQKFVSETQKVFPDLINKPDNIQVVLVNMCFNLGAPRLSKFKKFITAINDEQWIEAAVEMMDSRWARQVGPRAERLKQIVLDQAN
jgi:lysozyme